MGIPSLKAMSAERAPLVPGPVFPRAVKWEIEKVPGLERVGEDDEPAS